MRLLSTICVLFLLSHWLVPANAQEERLDAPLVVGCGDVTVTLSNTSLLSLKIDSATDRCNVSVNGASTGLRDDRYIEVLQSARRSLAYGKLSPWELIEFLPFYLAASAEEEGESERLLEAWHRDPESRWQDVDYMARCFDSAMQNKDVQFESEGETFACRSHVPMRGVRVIEISAPRPLESAIEYRFVIPVPTAR